MALPYGSYMLDHSNNYLDNSNTLLSAVDGSNGGVVVGSCYVFPAEGMLSVEQNYKYIQTTPEMSLNWVDVTNALQIRLDVAMFNALLGLHKDVSNQVIDVSDNFKDGSWNVTDISLSFTQIFGKSQHIHVVGASGSHIDASYSPVDFSGNNVASVGDLSNAYFNFQANVNTYFGWVGGFASLFNYEAQREIGIALNPTSFTYLVQGLSGSLHNTTSVVISEASSNSIKIPNINSLLRFAVDTNAFGNRDPSGENPLRYAGTQFSGDPSANNTYNFGLKDGFIEGDLIYIQHGFELTLSIDISNELFASPLNNIGNVQMSSFIEKTFGTNSKGTETLTTSLNDITKKFKVPLLIILENRETINLGGINVDHVFDVSGRLDQINAGLIV
jgi:hypothetical protein